MIDCYIELVFKVKGALTEIVRTLSKSRYKEILLLRKKDFRHNNLRKSLRMNLQLVCV